jgi:glycosyltransferase involved in cell wall biosynthesis
LRIAQIAPLYESVPPKQYGGTERVVSYLTEELVRRGHDVSLFASGDSKTRAKLIPCSETSLRISSKCVDSLAYHFMMLERVMKYADDFDLLHFHIDYLHYPLSSRNSYTHLTTLHGRLDIPELVPLYEEYYDVPVVSISDSQRTSLPHANWVGTVYHGLPRAFHSIDDRSRDYLAFLGRISPEKRVDRAIQIALQSGLEIKIAAKIDKNDKEYFEDSIQPLFDNPFVTYLGEINEEEKKEFLSGALALLFPIDWEEPFGLVMIEAMASGTPVIAWRNGSVPEIIEDGVNGFIVESIEEAITLLKNIHSFDHKRCQQVFEKRFTARRMADDYCAIYENLLAKKYRKIS